MVFLYFPSSPFLSLSFILSIVCLFLSLLIPYATSLSLPIANFTLGLSSPCSIGPSRLQVSSFYPFVIASCSSNIYAISTGNYAQPTIVKRLLSHVQIGVAYPMTEDLSTGIIYVSGPQTVYSIQWNVNVNGTDADSLFNFTMNTIPTPSSPSGINNIYVHYPSLIIAYSAIQYTTTAPVVFIDLSSAPTYTNHQIVSSTACQSPLGMVGYPLPSLSIILFCQNFDPASPSVPSNFTVVRVPLSDALSSNSVETVATLLILPNANITYKLSPLSDIVVDTNGDVIFTTEKYVYYASNPWVGNPNFIEYLSIENTQIGYSNCLSSFSNVNFDANHNVIVSCSLYPIYSYHPSSSTVNKLLDFQYCQGTKNIQYSPYSGLWYAACTQNGIIEFDVNSIANTAHHIDSPITNPGGMVVDNTRGLLYVASQAGGIVVLGNVGISQAATITDCPGAQDVAVDETMGIVYASCQPSYSSVAPNSILILTPSSSSYPYTYTKRIIPGTNSASICPLPSSLYFSQSQRALIVNCQFSIYVYKADSPSSSFVISNYQARGPVYFDDVLEAILATTISGGVDKISIEVANNPITQFISPSVCLNPSQGYHFAHDDISHNLSIICGLSSPSVFVHYADVSSPSTTFNITNIHYPSTPSNLCEYPTDITMDKQGNIFTLCYTGGIPFSVTIQLWSVGQSQSTTNTFFSEIVDANDWVTEPICNHPVNMVMGSGSGNGNEIIFANCQESIMWNSLNSNGCFPPLSPSSPPSNCWNNQSSTFNLHGGNANGNTVSSSTGVNVVAPSSSSSSPSVSPIQTPVSLSIPVTYLSLNINISSTLTPSTYPIALLLSEIKGEISTLLDVNPSQVVIVSVCSSQYQYGNCSLISVNGNGNSNRIVIGNENGSGKYSLQSKISKAITSNIPHSNNDDIVPPPSISSPSTTYTSFRFYVVPLYNSTTQQTVSSESSSSYAQGIISIFNTTIGNTPTAFLNVTTFPLLSSATPTSISISSFSSPTTVTICYDGQGNVIDCGTQTNNNPNGTPNGAAGRRGAAGGYSFILLFPYIVFLMLQIC